MNYSGDPLLRQVRKRIAISYGHKAVLFALAAFGFMSLHWLGGERKDYEKQQKSRWLVTGKIRTAVERATGEPLCAAFEEQAAQEDPAWCIKNTVYETREQLISALQDISEASAWARFRAVTSDAHTKMQNAKMQNAKLAQDEYVRFADFVAHEETYAKALASAARKSVGARLAAMDLKPEKPPEETLTVFEELIQPTLDPGSDTHVIYQILWYASLLIGVVASSMLLVIVFTALPITTAEGYWTKRINELIEWRPGSAMRSIVAPLLAAPLLTAALAGGTLAGAAMATEAGGNARPPKDQRAQSDQGNRIPQSPKIELPKGDPPKTGEEKPPVPPDEVSERLDAIDESLAALSRAITNGFTGVTGRIGDTEKTVVKRMGGVGSKVNNKVSQTAREVQHQIAELRQPVSETNLATQATLKGVTDITPKVTETHQNVGTLSTRVKEHEYRRQEDTRDIRGRAENIQATQLQQDKAAIRTLAQNAQRDPRGFLGRTFGPTLFKIGPLVIETMDARLGESKVPDAERTAFRNALTAIQQQQRKGEHEPKHGAETYRVFKAHLRTELLASGASVSPEVSATQVEALIANHFSALVRICALPR